MGVNVLFIITWIPKHIVCLVFFFHFRDGVGGIGGRRQGERIGGRGKAIGDKKPCIRFSVFYYFNYDAN